MATLGQELQSIVWGNDEYPVTQEFGTYNAATAGMYNYASDYGWAAGTHIGLDVGVPYGTDIYAAEAGTVVQSGFSNSFRPFPVWIEETDGDIAIYGHLSENAVKTGQTVKRGQRLGKSGEQTEYGTTTPDGTGPHIHFELRRDGKAVDPTTELSGTGSTFGSTSYKSLSPAEMISGTPGKILFIGAGIGAVLFGLAMLKG